MITTPVTLSEVKGSIIIDDTPDNRYSIEVEPGEHLVIEAGSLVGSPASRFTHPNIALTAKRIYYFKRYFPNGGKRWTSKAGVSFYLVVSRSAVQLLPEKGYSYIPAVINEVTVKFNVSGGTKDGWTDWLRTYTQISVGHCLRDLKGLAAVAVRGTPLEPIPGGEMEQDRAERWEQLAAKQSLRLAVGQTVTLEEGWGHAPCGPFTVTNLRPLCGRTETGTVYRLPRRYLQVPAG